MAVKSLYINLLLLLFNSVLSEVIQLDRDKPPSEAMKDFEFIVINYVDNSRASKESI